MGWRQLRDGSYFHMASCETSRACPSAKAVAWGQPLPQQTQEMSPVLVTGPSSIPFAFNLLLSYQDYRVLC